MNNYRLKNAGSGEWLPESSYPTLEDALRAAWRVATGDNYSHPADCDTILIVDESGNDIDFVEWHDGEHYQDGEEFVRLRRVKADET